VILALNLPWRRQSSLEGDALVGDSPIAVI
jgi:hypothetical protein